MKQDIISKMQAAGMVQAPGINWPVAHFESGGAAGDGGGGGGNEYTVDSGPSRPSDAVRFALPKPKTPLYTGHSLVEQVQNSNPGMKSGEAQAVALQLYKSGVKDLNATQAYGYADKQILVNPEQVDDYGNLISPATYRAPTAADIRPEYSTDLLTEKGDSVPTSFDLGNHYVANIGVGADGLIKPAVSYQEPDHGFFGNLLHALGPLAPIAIGLIAPELLPALGSFAAPALSAGVGLLAGQDPLKALEGAGLSYIGGNIAGGISGGLTDALGSTGANLAGKAISSEIMSGGKADLGKLLKNAAISGGIGELTNTGPSSSDMIEGYFAPGGEGYIAPETPAEQPYTPTTDYSIGANYNLFDGNTAAPSLEDMGGGQGLQVAPVNENQNVGYEPVDYGFNTSTPFEGLQMPTVPNDPSMGGGQGLTVPVAGGTMTGSGLIDSTYTPDLGDPNSFINQPAPGGDVSAAVKAATDKAAMDRAAATKAASDKAAADKAAADKAAADKAAADKAAADKAAKDKAANDAFNQLKAQAQAQQNQQDALMKMMSSNNDVAHIKSDTSLFGAIPGMEPPASSAQQTQADPLAALQGMDQQYASGGHVDDFSVEALLHILRS